MFAFCSPQLDPRVQDWRAFLTPYFRLRSFFELCGLAISSALSIASSAMGGRDHTGTDGSNYLDTGLEVFLGETGGEGGIWGATQFFAFGAPRPLQSEERSGRTAHVRLC